MKIPSTLMVVGAGLLAGMAISLGMASDASKRPVEKVAPFSLTDPRDNRSIDLAGWKDKKGIVVLFLGTECLLSNEYLGELSRLQKEFTPKGIAFLGINSNRQDTPASVAAHARKHAIGFPVVKDPANRIADRFGARRTPEAFLLGPEGRIVYRGRIDDQFGIGYRRPGKPTRRDLACAIEEVLVGKSVSQPTTEPAGCYIGRVRETASSGKVTFTKDVARILQNHCQECHRPGQFGPMGLLTYDDAVSWAETIREVIDEERMPPWYADRRFGKWKNERGLSKEEKATLRAWLDGGMPKGEAGDAPLPRKFPETWQIGEPDHVVTMPRAYDVPAEASKGGVPYQYFSVQTNFDEDRWVERCEVRPGAPEVVHHIIMFIVPPGERFRPDGPGSVLCGMAPGDMPMIAPPGLAKKIPKGARLLFQMHYTPNGKAQSDRSSVALIFAKQPPKHQILTKPIHNGWFLSKVLSIPPGAEDHKIQASHTFKEGVRIVGMMPHMHLRGKDFLYEAVYPDGKTETLLSVPRWNFNWQSVYQAEKPISLPAGTKLRCVAHYDNSAKNPQNPDPTQRLFWGDQTWEEMMIGWIDYYVATD